MSVVDKLDLFSGSLPRKCLYCAWGYPVVFGMDDWLEVLACGRWTVGAFAIKRIGLRLADETPEQVSRAKSKRRGLSYMVAPLVRAWDACERFEPVRCVPMRGKFSNARKFELLDRSGVFDDMEGL